MTDGNVVCASYSVSHKLVSVRARSVFSRSNSPSIVQSDKFCERFDSKKDYVFRIVTVSTRWIHVNKVVIAVERKPY
jgi:hypothetical protein